MIKYSLAVIAILSMQLFFSCKKEKDTPGEEKDPAISFTLYDIANLQAGNSTEHPVLSFADGESQLTTFSRMGSTGSLERFNKMYAYNKTANSEAVILLDENGAPAFIYGVDLATGKKSAGITEFQTKDNNSFYYRVYDYDWQNRIGTLLFETVITKNGSNFSSAPSFQGIAATASRSVTVAGSRGSLRAGKGGSFSTKIARLQYYQTLQNQQLQDEFDDAIQEFSDGLDDIRNNVIGSFLSQVQKHGSTAAVLSAIGVAAGVTAASPVFIATAGVTMAATAMQLVISDRGRNMVRNLQNRVNDIKETVSTIDEVTAQRVTSYGQRFSNWLNSSLNSMTGESILRLVDENSLLSSTTDLDDLPTSAGVLQIGLSWNTDATDIDLWVTDPNGEKIYFENPEAASGGYLDRDDVDGFGPENVYWGQNVPNGKYTIQVHYYGCDNEPGACPSTNYEVKLSNGLGFKRVFNGVLGSRDAQRTVASFNVLNGQISL